MTDGRQPLLIPGTGISDRPQPPRPQQFLQLTELLRPQRTLHRSRVLSQELRVITPRKHAEDLDRVIRIVLINRMRSHSPLRFGIPHGLVPTVVRVPAACEQHPRRAALGLPRLSTLHPTTAAGTGIALCLRADALGPVTRPTSPPDPADYRAQSPYGARSVKPEMPNRARKSRSGRAAEPAQHPMRERSRIVLPLALPFELPAPGSRLPVDQPKHLRAAPAASVSPESSSQLRSHGRHPGGERPREPAAGLDKCRSTQPESTLLTASAHPSSRHPEGRQQRSDLGVGATGFEPVTPRL